jgi:hypothetical protein
VREREREGGREGGRERERERERERDGESNCLFATAGGKLTPKIAKISATGGSTLTCSSPEPTYIGPPSGDGILRPPQGGQQPTHLLLISGGTGLAPILQALKYALGLDGTAGTSDSTFSSILLVHSSRCVDFKPYSILFNSKALLLSF